METQAGVTFVGGFCIPHGAIALDPLTRDLTSMPGLKTTTKEDAARIHDAIRVQASVLMSYKPDLILMSTPHGLQLKNTTLLFFGNPRAKGSCEWDGNWKEYAMTIDIDVQSTNIIVKELKEQKQAVDIVSIGHPIEDVLPLRWAEVMPMWFIKEAAAELKLSLPKTVLIGQKMYGDGDIQSHIEELMGLGNNLMSITTTHPHFKGKRIAVVISADLAHTHSTASLCTDTFFKFSPAATVFDSSIAAWAKLNITNTAELQRSTELLTKEAAKHLQEAWSCGYTGMVMLQGMMEESMRRGCKGFTGSFHEYQVPTYYGMMVNSFLPIQ